MNDLDLAIRKFKIVVAAVGGIDAAVQKRNMYETIKSFEKANNNTMVLAQTDKGYSQRVPIAVAVKKGWKY